jgi:HTH-type transcriptional regulator/antitoxin HipB
LWRVSDHPQPRRKTAADERSSRSIHRHYRYFTFICYGDIINLSPFPMELAVAQILSTSAQVGQVLASRRRALKLSQQAVATKLGISQNRLSELEENPDRLTLDRLLALANVLRLELTIHDQAIRDQAASPPTAGEW